jgi:DNA primase
MRIPDAKIDEIRNAADIVDVISREVSLKKRGKNFVGLCPFHSEDTPSFTVSREKQIYHCFGCGAGGDLFRFMMEFKKISFVEAVQEIADFVGIPIEPESGYSEKYKAQEELYDIMSAAVRYFTEILHKSKEAEEARNYLVKRNIKPPTQKLFNIGFAPYGWDNFLTFAKQNGIDLQKAKTLGLIDTKQNGEYYDKLRGRIIFPIHSTNGRIIAYGARILDDSEKAAKYINSPETPIYSKREVLYGLFHSKEEIRKLDRAILVEGYMDLISLFQEGVQNVVASSGTSLTEEQVTLLSRFTKNIYVLFDADAAGQNAALRSIEILLKHDFDIKVVSLPEGEDPDSFIKKHGREKFQEQLQKAQNFFEFTTSKYASEGKFDDPATSAAALREIIKSLALVKDELKLNFYIKSIARKFNLREKLIEKELDEFRKNASGRTETRKAAAPGYSKPNVTTAQKANPYERELARLLLSGKEEIVDYILEKVGSESFSHPNLKKIAEIVAECHKQNNVSTANILDHITDENLREFLRLWLMKDEQISTISDKWDNFYISGKLEKDTLEHAVQTVRNYFVYKIEEEIKSNNELIQKNNDEMLHLELLKRNKELYEQKKELLNN